MLTGVPAFDGEEVSEILARVIEREPDWSKLPPNVPSRIRELLRRCLEKDSKKRRRDAGDVRFDIVQAMAEPAEAPPLATAAARPRVSPGSQRRSPLPPRLCWDSFISTARPKIAPWSG